MSPRGFPPSFATLCDRIASHFLPVSSFLLASLHNWFDFNGLLLPHLPKLRGSSWLGSCDGCSKVFSKRLEVSFALRVLRPSFQLVGLKAGSSSGKRGPLKVSGTWCFGIPRKPKMWTCYLSRAHSSPLNIVAFRPLRDHSSGRALSAFGFSTLQTSKAQ